MSSTPYMPFYVESYLADTTRLTMEEQGAYTRLLFNMWINGAYLLDDDRKLAKMLGIHTNKWLKLKPALKPFFLYTTQDTPPDTPQDTPIDTPPDTRGVVKGVFTQVKLLEVYEHVQGKRKKNRDNVRRRWERKPAENLESDDTTVPPVDDTTVSPPDNTAVQNGVIPNEDKLKLNKNLKEASYSFGGAENCGQVGDRLIRSLSTVRDIELQIKAIFHQYKLTSPNDLRVIKEWLQIGAVPELHIIPVITEIIERNAKRNLAPPKTLSYFTNRVIEKAGGKV